MRLSEGMIKLPPVYNELKATTLTWYFAYLEYILPKRFEGDELEQASRLVKAAEERYDIVVGTADITAAKRGNQVREFSVEDTPYGRCTKFKGRLEMLFTKDEALGRNPGVYHNEDAFIRLSPLNLRMTGPSLATVSALRASLAKIEKLISLLRHEVTHLVQYRVIGHPDQVKHHKEYDSEGDDYMLSPLEFDPMIKTAVGTFAGLKAKYEAVSGYNEQALAEAFVLAADPPEWMDANDISVFFDTLYHRARAKWRKAVKLFMSELSVS